MRDLVIPTAESYLGIPYKHQGRSEYGVDCVGLLYVVFRDLGVDFAYPRNYQRTPKQNEIFHFVSNFSEETDCPIKGDVVLLGNERLLTHAAIFIDKYTYIHACQFNRSSRGNVRYLNLKTERSWARRHHRFFSPDFY